VSPLPNFTASVNETIVLEDGASTPCDNASLSCIHCSFAELIISGFNAPASREAGLDSRLGHQDAARSPIILASRVDSPPVIGAGDFNKGEWLRGDYSTGEWVDGFAPTVPSDGQAIHSAVIELDVSPDRCWWHDDDICTTLFYLQSETAVDMNALILSIMNILLLTGIGLASVVILQRVYVIFQLTALAWDTDGDGVVELDEVKQAIKVIFGGWILHLRGTYRARFQRGAPQVTRVSERKLEWRAALYGILFSVSKVNFLQFVLLCTMLFLPGPIYFTMISPCRECTDFHLTVVTQLGLVLGLQNYSRPATPIPNASDVANQSAPSPSLPPPEFPPPPLVPQPELPPPSAPPTVFTPPNVTAAPPPPPSIYATNRSAGYNCSHPSQAVELLATATLSAEGAPHSVMGQPRPERFSLFGAWPRSVCPTDDDADGLRFLYPECEELLGCEAPGGAELFDALDPNSTKSCARFVPTSAGYSIIDYYTPTSTSNWTHPNFTWSALPLGRALPSTACIDGKTTPKGAKSTGLFRLGLLFYKETLIPIVILLLAKVLCRLCLLMPWMTRTRKRNEKLQRTAAKRKAEVRRMTEGGQEFVVKRTAKASGQGHAAEG
jgi:hypothetical protein